MPEQYESTTPVLVVGGSLVGLSAAVFLAWRGVPVVVAEKHAGSSPHPRAIGYTTRTLELYRSVGLTLPASSDTRAPRRARVASLAGEWFEEYPWTPGGGEASPSAYSPVAATALAQDRLEPLLRQRALELGAEVRQNTRLTALAQDADGVTAQLAERDGRTYELRARYVVAADGAESFVRDELGVGRDGRGLLSVQRSILFRAPLEEYLAHGVVQFEIRQPELSAFLTTYGDGRWVLMLADDVPRDEAEQLRLVRQAIGRPEVPVELLTTGRWELAALIADRFRVGRVLLAGDAAHQLPPNRGGFGANTGIEDAHNLAWKLAAVLAGESDLELLETYDAERRPIAWLRHEQLFARADFKAYLADDGSTAPVLGDAAIELGALYRSAAVLGADPQLPPARRPDEWAGQPGTRAPHLWVRVEGTERSLLDVLQRGWTLLATDVRWADAAKEATARLGIEVCFVHIGRDVEPLTDGEFEAAFGLAADGAALIRPDGYLAWRATMAPEEPAAALSAALGQVASVPGERAAVSAG